jgi:hypothetical protein
MTWDEVYHKTLSDITEARSMIEVLQDKGFIKEPDISLLEAARDRAVLAVSK